MTIDFPDEMNAGELHIGENLAINITHNKPNILHFSKVKGSKNSSINFANNSITYQKKDSNLKNIEIKSEEYKKEANANLNYIATTTNISDKSYQVKRVTSQLICSKCKQELSTIDPYYYSLYTEVTKEGYADSESLTVLKQLINNKILNSLSFPIECTTCNISFWRNDINIEIHLIICLLHCFGCFYATCSVCSQVDNSSVYDNNNENVQLYFNQLKEKFVDKKTPCGTCDVTYYGIKWWNGSAYVDYLVLLGNAIAKLDYTDEKVHYEYSNLKCENGHDISITTDEDGTVLTKPSDLFSSLRCEQCNNNFTSEQINIKYYLYFPKYCLYNGYNYVLKLYCLNCYMNNSYRNISSVSMNDSLNNILTYDNPNLSCHLCLAGLISKEDYLNNQIGKVSMQGLDVNYYYANEEAIALLQYNP